MTRKGVWGLQQVRDKYLASLWEQAFYLQSMGQGNYGEMLNNENGDNASRSSPVQLGGTLATGWRSIDTGEESFLGTTDDGKLWVAGYNQSYGPLGMNNGTNYSSPTQVGTDTTWDTVKSKNYTSMAVKTDGTLWTWGRNSAGALGHNNNTAYSSPKQVGTNTTWSKIVVAGATMFSIKTDGTLWCWGNNEVGELGQNNTTDYSSPRQMGTGTDWKRVWGTYSDPGRKFWASKTDGTIWNWGNGGYGALDHNIASGDVHQLSSPTQLGTDTSYSGLNTDQVCTCNRVSYILKPLLTPSQL